jgi:hypothetical protein
MVDLKDITLISISDSVYIEKTIKALNHCAKKCKFYDIKLLTNDESTQTTNINKNVIKNSLDEINYSKLCINDLTKYIDSKFCLLIQWDGFIINEKLFQDKFFEYDYIGAPWGFPSNCKNRVGNGGFSLRSKKFLDISSHIEYTPYDFDTYTDLLKVDRPIAPEDWFLCYHSYEKMLDKGIKFAPIDIAYSFSVEHTSFMKNYNRNDIETYNSFGFHGHFNTAAMKLLEI